MTIEELQHGHFKEYLRSDVLIHEKQHTKLSIEFAISVLKEVFGDGCGNLNECCSLDDLVEEYRDKIQELKNYLNEKV